MVVTNIAITAIKTSVITDFTTNISHTAVGDDATTPTESDTTLTNETYIDALFSESSLSDRYIANMFLDITENNSNTILEYGLFTSASGGDMYIHSLTNSITKTSDVEAFIESQINIKIGNL